LNLLCDRASLHCNKIFIPVECHEFTMTRIQPEQTKNLHSKDGVGIRLPFVIKLQVSITLMNVLHGFATEMDKTWHIPPPMTRCFRILKINSCLQNSVRMSALIFSTGLPINWREELVAVTVFKGNRFVKLVAHYKSLWYVRLKNSSASMTR